MYSKDGPRCLTACLMNTWIQGTSHLNPHITSETHNFFSLARFVLIYELWSNQIFHAFILTLRSNLRDDDGMERFGDAQDDGEKFNLSGNVFAVCWTLGTVFLFLTLNNKRFSFSSSFFSIFVGTDVAHLSVVASIDTFMTFDSSLLLSRFYHHTFGVKRI